MSQEIRVMELYYINNTKIVQLIYWGVAIWVAKWKTKLRFPLNSNHSELEQSFRSNKHFLNIVIHQCAVIALSFCSCVFHLLLFKIYVYILKGWKRTVRKPFIFLYFYWNVIQGRWAIINISSVINNVQK